MGYITRSKSLTSNDGKKTPKKKKLPTVEENKVLVMSKIRDEIKQKKKSRSEGELFEDLASPFESQQPISSLTAPEVTINQNDDLVDRIKDEIQAWVIPQV